MDSATLVRAFRCNTARANASLAGMNQAMTLAECTTVRRAAMWCAQIGHETLSLYYDQEIWGPTAAQRRYEGRSDLGNTVTGDGYRYRGRGRIQLTGRTNYGAFSRWCHGRGLVPSPTHFVDNPDLVATAPWRELAATWYWTVARPGINTAADRGDVRAVTKLINGGTNGLADRQDRYDSALALGTALLPTGATTLADPQEDDMTPEQDRMLREVYLQLVQGDGQQANPKTWGWQQWTGGTGEHLTVVDALRRGNVEQRQTRNALAALQESVNKLLGR